MQVVDILFVIRWWATFFIIGLIFLPITCSVFSKFFDKGYIFSKIIGIACISYVVFNLGVLKLLPFTLLTIDAVIIGFFIFNIFLIRKYPNILVSLKNSWRIFLFEELLFILAFFSWSFIRGHQPDIYGLEKYMDFGFINSILRSTYFPPPDMWFTPYPINYYYFGHLVTAVLTKLSVIPSSVTFNLMLATIFGFTFTCGFSIGLNLFNASGHLGLSPSGLRFRDHSDSRRSRRSKTDGSRIFSASVVAGFLTGILLSLAGNLHTIYAFFKPYVNENPVPFWQLSFSLNSSPNSYWYPNATRFIHNTIHEFPIYSSVVSDLHGHFLDISFVLLTIAVMLSLISKPQITRLDSAKRANHKSQINPNVQNTKPLAGLNFGNWELFGIWKLGFGNLLLISFLLAVMYMTNAWDSIIYFLLTAIILFYINFQPKPKVTHDQKIENFKLKILSWLSSLITIAITLALFALPFSLHFKPFASGIGVLCAPEFLTKMGKIGPFLFEADHCQHSPWWQLFLLYGFFYFWAISFLIFLIKKKNHKSQITNHEQIQNYNVQNSKYFGFLNFKNLASSDLFVSILIIFSTLLIIIPEFIYVKDIYPGHYRANTMFKLVYQAFIMLSISSAYVMARVMPLVLRHIKNSIPNIFNIYFVFFIFSILFFILVMIYPYFAINSYYGDLKKYDGLDGTAYLKPLYPNDYQAILWINKNIKGQPGILEAQGDSYTDYARVSSNTGLPTVLGWTVHEWLWRGSYDIPSPRIEEVQKMYESEDLEETKSLLKKYKVTLVFLGDLERQKYPKLNENKFKKLGKVVYESGKTRVFKVD